MKTHDIKSVLMKSLYNSKDLFCDNFQGCGLAECDVLRITGSGMTYEYEIKVSISDFKADFKKTRKHLILQGLHKTNPHKWNYPGGGIDTEEVLQERHGSVDRCNYFYYVTKEGLIKESEVPKYAGLIYVWDDRMEIVKKAPKLHSFKATEKLMRKVCHVLSARNIFGSSYMTYQNKENERKWLESQEI